MDTQDCPRPPNESHLSLKVLHRLLDMAIAEGQAEPDRPCLFFLSGSRTDEVQSLPPAGTVRLGRRPECEVAFDPVGDPKVSSFHAELTLDEGGACLADCGSKNGTFVNGARIDTPTRLQSGDLIQLSPAGPQIAFVTGAED